MAKAKRKRKTTKRKAGAKRRTKKASARRGGNKKSTKGGRKKRKVGSTVTIRKKGKKPITFKAGALHRQLGVPQGQPIPEAKKRAALRGDYGPLAKKRANFAFRGALKKGRQTVAKRRKPKKKSATRAKAKRKRTRRRSA